MKLVQLLGCAVIGGSTVFAFAGCASRRDKLNAKTEPLGVAIPATAEEKRVSLAYLTGGDLGIGGGFLIGAAPEKIKNHLKDEAVTAAQKGEQSPARPEQVHDATTADLNHDGYVTLDEILALVRAGLNDAEILDRLKNTGYVFQITPEQERYLTDRGVREKVVDGLRTMSHHVPPSAVRT